MSRYIDREGPNDEWMRDGACIGIEPSAFFPNLSNDQRAIAALVCSNCVVKQECLEYALRNRIDHGVWGGATESERRRILKNAG